MFNTKFDEFFLHRCKQPGTFVTFSTRSRYEELRSVAKNSDFHLIKLTLETSSNFVTELEIRRAKTFVEFLGEIGGHLGLFVGISLITLIELLEILCKLVCKNCWADYLFARRKTRGTTRPLVLVV